MRINGVCSYKVDMYRILLIVSFLSVSCLLDVILLHIDLSRVERRGVGRAHDWDPCRVNVHGRCSVSRWLGGIIR